MRETEVEGYMVAEVEKRGGIAAKHVSPGRNGDPDRLICLPGKPAALCELKRPGREPDPLQWHRIKEWNDIGMLAGYAATKAQVDEFIKRMEQQ